MSDAPWGSRKGGSTHPLDFASPAYAYTERPNRAVQSLYAKHFARGSPRVLDVGCGCGSNDRAFKKKTPHAFITGVEPDARAAELAARTCDEVFEGGVEEWLRLPESPRAPYDLVVLADVLEHLADPVGFLRTLASRNATRQASWILSVPNYAVWLNRLQTTMGLQRYAWSGTWDRTHLRFFTRQSLEELLAYVGFELLDAASTPSLVHAAAPLVRRMFERAVAEGDHLALAESRAFGVYQRLVEPFESLVCSARPELLALQFVYLARWR